MDKNFFFMKPMCLGSDEKPVWDEKKKKWVFKDDDN